MSSGIKIEELESKSLIEDSNLIIIEDSEDSKKATVKELKRAFNGDSNSPSDSKFYSTKKTENLLDQLKIELSTKASDKKLQKLEASVNDLIINSGSGSGSGDSSLEVIEAREGYSTLKERLNSDKDEADKMYMNKYAISKSGNPLIFDFEGNASVYIKADSQSNGLLYNRSINLLDYTKVEVPSTNGIISIGNREIKYTQISSSNKYCNVVFNFIDYMPIAGNYKFYVDIDFSEYFIDKGEINFVVNYSDNTSDKFVYDQNGYFEFCAFKPISSISLLYNEVNYANNNLACVTLKNIMLVPYDINISSYIDYHYESISVNGGENVYGINIDHSILQCSIPQSTLIISGYDESITTNTIYEDINYLKETISSTIDYCGLMEDYGHYQFFDNYNYDNSVCQIKQDPTYRRNGKNSIKVTVNHFATDNPKITQELSDNIDIVDNVALQFYIDKTTAENFTSSDGIRLYLSCDDETSETINQYVYFINRSQMLQGWNTCKRNISEFNIVGDPNPAKIKKIIIEIARNDSLNGLSLWINSVIFNSRMKPTILLSFDGYYPDNGFTFTYPLLTSKGIPCTIFGNDKTTLTLDNMNELSKLKSLHGWDLGIHGCNPNKELLTMDDNPRDQYLALSNSKNWLVANMNNPTSYSAPYGNLRPITVPILKNMGYNIARTEGDTYCGFFSDKDLSIPQVLISNETTTQDIIKKIDYIIETGQALSLYTYDVTNYGDEINAKKEMFESIINYLVDKINDGELQCLTFSDFYNKCTNKDANHIGNSYSSPSPEELSVYDLTDILTKYCEDVSGLTGKISELSRLIEEQKKRIDELEKLI